MKPEQVDKVAKLVDSAEDTLWDINIEMVAYRRRSGDKDLPKAAIATILTQAIYKLEAALLEVK